MKILIMHPSSDMYGSDRMMLETAVALRACGAEVLVQIPNHGPLEQALIALKLSFIVKNFPIVRKISLTWKSLIPHALASFLAVIQLALELHRKRVDLIWVNTVVCPVALFAARISATLSVVHVREAEHDLPAWQQHLLLWPLRMAQRIVCNSENSRRFVLNNYRTLSPRTEVVYNGKNWSEYACPPPASAVGPTVVLSVGRLNPRKGHATAIRAIAALASSGYEVQLRIAGDVFPGYEWYEEELRSNVTEFGLVGRCEFLGFVGDMQSVMEASHLIVIPSTLESFGTTVLEAMAAGRPTIACNIPGVDEVVTDGVTGFLFQPDDHEDLARVIEGILQDSDKADRVAKAGKTMVASGYSLSAYRAEIQRIALSVMDLS